MSDQPTNGSTTGEAPTASRPKWQRPEISVLNVERGTLHGVGVVSDGSSGNTTS